MRSWEDSGYQGLVGAGKTPEVRRPDRAERRATGLDVAATRWGCEVIRAFLNPLVQADIASRQAYELRKAARLDR
jgi:hypothetical protein